MHRNAKLESSDSTPSFTDVATALKTISQSTNRNDMRRIVGIVFYLRADVGYVNHDAVLASAMRGSADQFIQLRLRVHAAGRGEQFAEYLQFRGRKGNHVVVLPNDQGLFVEFYGAHAHDRTVW